MLPGRRGPLPLLRCGFANLVEINLLQFLDVLFFAVIAAFLIFRLWGVLGRRSDLDQPPPASSWRLHRDEEKAPRANGKAADERASDEKVVRLSDRNAEIKTTPEAAPEALSETPPEAGPKTARPATAFAAIFTAMGKKETDFDPESFLSGAKGAFDLAVNAFANGDKKALQALLSKETQSHFVAAIDAREAKGETLETTIVRILGAEIEDASLKDNLAQIAVRFRSEQIKFTRDKDGAVIDGDPNTVRLVTDVWTFERRLGSRNPNWVLVATHGSA